MSSSISIWQTPVRDGPASPDKTSSLEVHINLWRYGTGRGERNLLDLGVRTKTAGAPSSFRIFVPVVITSGELADLGNLLRDADTCNAVFSETLSAAPSLAGETSFTIRKGANRYATVYPIDVSNDLVLENVSDDAGRGGTILAFSDAFCRRFVEPESYFRLRFKLSQTAAREFTSDLSSSDAIVLSAVAISELTEMRFSESRSLPMALQNQANSEGWVPARVITLYYFLIRESSYDLIAAQSSFRKMRRLEERIWQRYLSDLAHDIAAENLVIHQWKWAGEKEKPEIDDVVTLAKFRRARPNIWWYLYLVVILGAAGSATQALTVALGKEAGLVEWLASLVSFALILALAVIPVLFFLSRPAWQRPKQGR